MVLHGGRSAGGGMAALKTIACVILPCDNSDMVVLVFSLSRSEVGSLLKGVEASNSRRGHVLQVAGHHHEIMHQRGGSDESIDIRQRIGDTRATPALRNSAIDIQNTISEPVENEIQPQGNRSDGVPTADPFNAVPQFTQGQNAQENLPWLAPTEPINHQWIGSLALPELRDHVGIDQIAHNSVRRGPERTRSKSLSCPPPGIASR